MDDCLRAGEQDSACWFQSRDSGFAHTNLDENNQTANPLSSNEALRASLCSLDVRSRGSTCLQLGLAFLWLLCTILGSLWNTSEVPGHSEGGNPSTIIKGGETQRPSLVHNPLWSLCLPQDSSVFAYAFTNDVTGKWIKRSLLITSMGTTPTLTALAFCKFGGVSECHPPLIPVSVWLDRWLESCSGHT